MIIVVIIIIILLSCWFCNDSLEYFENEYILPKTIYTYWQSRKYITDKNKLKYLERLNKL